jgi:predicted metalloprotease
VRLASLAVLAALLLAAPACGEEDARRAADSARERVEELKEEGRQLSDEFRQRVREVLDEIRQAVPDASLPTPQVQDRPSALEAYMQEVLTSVDGYWTRTLTTAGLQEPRVSYFWVPRGRRVLTACQVVADDRAAFYCSADDAIYLAESFAGDVYRGIADDLPGERAGQGNAVGEFGLAYVIAHEYAHNVQFELGIYQLQPAEGVKAFELQADCMAGLWGNAVYREGRYDEQDVEQAISTAQAVGDFDFGAAQHHGTPDERRAAWLDGFRTGDPSRCRRYVPGT